MSKSKWFSQPLLMLQGTDINGDVFRMRPVSIRNEYPRLVIENVSPNVAYVVPYKDRITIIPSDYLSTSLFIDGLKKALVNNTLEKASVVFRNQDYQKGDKSIVTVCTIYPKLVDGTLILDVRFKDRDGVERIVDFPIVQNREYVELNVDNIAVGKKYLELWADLLKDSMAIKPIHDELKEEPSKED